MESESLAAWGALAVSVVPPAAAWVASAELGSVGVSLEDLVPVEEQLALVEPGGVPEASPVTSLPRTVLLLVDRSPMRCSLVSVGDREPLPKFAQALRT